MSELRCPQVDNNVKFRSLYLGLRLFCFSSESANMASSSAADAAAYVAPAPAGLNPALIGLAGRSAVREVALAAGAGSRTGDCDGAAATFGLADIAAALKVPTSAVSPTTILARLAALEAETGEEVEVAADALPRRDELAHSTNALASADASTGVAPADTGPLGGARVDSGAKGAAGDREERLMPGAGAAIAVSAGEDAEDEHAYRGPALGSRAKKEWPELVGLDVDAAASVVEAERPDMLMVQPTREGAIVAIDVVAARRVRLWYDPASRLVTRVPVIG
jgi:hypothetical protein